MQELKPCPFCGESGEKIQDFTYYMPGNICIGVFYCRNCGGAMIDTDKSHCWLDRAKLWNKRFCADGKKDGCQMKRPKETFWDSLSEADLMEPMRHFKD